MVTACQLQEVQLSENATSVLFCFDGRSLKTDFRCVDCLAELDHYLSNAGGDISPQARTSTNALRTQLVERRRSMPGPPNAAAGVAEAAPHVPLAPAHAAAVAPNPQNRNPPRRRVTMPDGVVNQARNILADFHAYVTPQTVYSERGEINDWDVYGFHGSTAIAIKSLLEDLVSGRALSLQGRGCSASRSAAASSMLTVLLTILGMLATPMTNTFKAVRRAGRRRTPLVLHAGAAVRKTFNDPRRPTGCFSCCCCALCFPASASWR